MAILVWTREEIILAMDLYYRVGAAHGGSIPGKNSAPVGEVSALLKELSAYPPAQQGERYRNTDGVYLKLTNLRAIETDGKHGMKSYSQLDAAVWREFVDDVPKLMEEAEAIRRRVSDETMKPAQSAASVQDVDIENRHTETFTVTPSGKPRTAERAEQALVLRYRDYMATKGIKANRKKYVPAGEVRPIYSDAWVEDRNALIEAKNSDSRENLRSAIGQLFDYRRFHHKPPVLAVLLPYRPKAERLELLRSAGIEALWPHAGRFRDSAGGQFT